MWDNKLTVKENLTKYFLKYWLLLLGLFMTFGALLYRPYGQDMQFLMDFLPLLGSIIIILFFIKLVNKKLPNPKGPLSWIYNTAVVLLIFWACSVAAATGAMLSETKRNPYVAGLDVILLGVELSAEHDQVMLESRLKPTAYYLKENPDNLAILSGGAYEDEELSTAQYMRDYLVEQGIAKDRLILDEESQTVPEAIVRTKAMVEELQGGEQTVAVGLISNEYQLYRARKYAAREEMLFAKMCIMTPLYKMLPTNFFLREYFKIIPMWLGR